MRLSKTLAAASAVAVLLAALGPASSQQPPPSGPENARPAGAPPAGGPPPSGTGTTPAAPAAAGLPPGGLAAMPGGPISFGPPKVPFAEAVIQNGPASAGRGAPYPMIPTTLVGPDARGLVRPGPGSVPQPIIAAQGGAVPDGITPLARDLYTSDDFYVDKDLWMDPRYWRCNSVLSLENQWGGDQNSALIVNQDVTTAAWGYCDRGYPRADIVSPYPYRTAQAHYEALLAEAKSRGGPTTPSAETLSKFDGYYRRVGFGLTEATSSWYRGAIVSVPTYLSLLTPEYQQRFVQQAYHTAHDNAPQWPGSYCWPEGFTRRWFGGPAQMIMATPKNVMIMAAHTEAMLTFVNIDRDFNFENSVPTLGPDVRQWYGETVGFWDGDILVTWTSNIKGWLSHGWHEWSDEMQSIEIYTPITDKAGNFIGINHDAVFYDPQALVDPVRLDDPWEKTVELNEGTPYNARVCAQTLFPIDGVTRPVSPGTTIEYTVPDWNNRPWATIWETYFETGMKVPAKKDVLADFQ